MARRGLKGEPLLARGGEEAMVQGNISTGGLGAKMASPWKVETEGGLFVSLKGG